MLKMIQKKSKGFTLIELLVVIAIIGILAAIVLVSLAGARQRAQAARVISDLNQIRSTAEIINSATGNYGEVATNGDISNLIADINAQGVNNSDIRRFVGGNNQRYCVATPIPGGLWGCVNGPGLVARFNYTSAPACSINTQDC